MDRFLLFYCSREQIRLVENGLKVAHIYFIEILGVKYFLKHKQKCFIRFKTRGDSRMLCFSNMSGI
jgi:hypothetical protein